MALQWQWEEQSGTVQYEGKTFPFWEGNAFMIAINMFKDNEGKDTHSLAWFLADKQHAKQCLGLARDSYDMFEGKVEKITIYKNHSQYWKDIVDLFMQSQPNIEITILPKNPEVAE